MSVATVEDLYPSRTGGEPGLSPRRDPVLHGEPTGALSDWRRGRYDADGFLCFEALFTPEELGSWQQEAERLRTDPALRGAPERIAEPDSDVTRSVFGVHRGTGLEALARHPKLIALARDLLGGEVYVHQSRVNYKPAFNGKEFYWHSDFETWHVEDGMPRMRALSVSVSLTENSEFNGPLMVMPGSHRQYVSCAGRTPENHHEQSLRRQEIGVPDDESLRRLAKVGGIVAPKGPAGSATLFECNLMHGSNSNICPWPRTNVFIVYNSVENALVDPFCGLAPRPDHVGNRSDFSPIEPA